MTNRRVDKGEVSFSVSSHGVTSGWRAAASGSTWRSRRRRGRSRRTRACSPGDGHMSWALTGSRPCATACRRSPNTWPRRDMTRRVSWRMSIIAPRRRGWPGASRIMRIIRSASSTRSPATWRSDGGSTSRLGRPPSNPSGRSIPGVGTTCCRSPESTAKRADAINGAFLHGSAIGPRSGRPFFAFLNFNDAHSPYEVPDPSIPGFGLRPSTAAQRQLLRDFIGMDEAKLSAEDLRRAKDVYDDCLFYMENNWACWSTSSAAAACSTIRC